MYQTFTATSPADFVDKLSTAAVAAGWTSVRNVLSGSVRLITLRKSGDYIHVWSGPSGFYITASVEYDAGSAGDQQPRRAQTVAYSNTGAGPFPNVLVFGGDDPAEYVFAVIEVTAGRYRHMGFGELVKIGTYTGGTFFDATFWHDDGASYAAPDPWSGYNRPLFTGATPYGYAGASGGYGGVHVDYDGAVDNFSPFASRANFVRPATGGMGGAGHLGGDDAYNNYSSYRTVFGFYDMSINSWSAQTPILPIQIRVARASPYWSPIGEVPGIRFLNMTRFAVGEEFTIGTDTWKVFPWVRRGSVGAGSPTWLQSSYEVAFAYRKVG